MSSVLIIPANQNDAFELTSLVNSAYRGESSKQGWTTEADLLDGQRTDEEKIKEMINPPHSYILKTLVENKIAGCVYLEKRDTDCYLGMLTVKPTLQNTGMGKQLLWASENHARSVMNCTSILMSVISVRSELLNWYIKHGYIDTGETKPFPADDPRFGILKVKKLEFKILRKQL